MRTLRRADLAAGVRRDIAVASTFSDRVTRAELEESGIRCLTGDLSDPAVLAALPEAAHVIYLLGFKFGSGSDWRRAFHVNGIVPYLVGERYPEASIVALSSTNPYPQVRWPQQAAGSGESTELDPVGVYGWSIVARESAFATTALRHPRQRVSLIRLSYAQHFAYGVIRDLAAMVWEGEPISRQVPAANLVSQRDAIDYTLLSMERSANPPWVVNIAGPALRVADLAERLGRVLGRRARLADAEGEAAVLADDRLCRATFGEPRDPVAELEEPIARWVMAGGLSGTGRPTSAAPAASTEGGVTPGRAPAASTAACVSLAKHRMVLPNTRRTSALPTLRSRSRGTSWPGLVGANRTFGVQSSRR